MRCNFVKIAVACSALFVTGCISAPPEKNLVGDYLSGRFAARDLDVDAAANAFSKARLEAPGEFEILRDAFFFQLASGNINDAIPLAEILTASEDSGDDGLAKAVLAAQAIKNKNYQQARDLLADGVDASYLAAAVTIIDAWAAAAIEGPDAAIELLRAPEADVFKGFNPLHLALMADKARRGEDARAAHQLSVMSFGGPVGRAAYGYFLERAGDETATREYYELLARDPGPARQMARLGVARLETGNASTAYADTTPAQGAAIAFYSLGAAILERTADQRSAAQRAGFRVGSINYNLPLLLTQVALYLDPDLDDARRLAGSIFNLYGNNEKAISMLSSIAPSSPYYEQSRIEIASGLAALDRTDDAIRVLHNLIRRDEDALEARFTLASLFAARDRHRESVDVMDALIEKLPAEPDDDAWRYYITRAAELLEIDDWPRAEQDLKRAVEIAPEQPTALNYLGYSWAERGENLDEAFELIEKAVALQPDSGAIIDSLGWAHFQLGHFDEAVGHLEQAAALEPGDPTITDHLGDVYWRLGRKIEAQYQWRRVIELEPDDDVIEAVETKLADGLPDTGE